MDFLISFSCFYFSLRRQYYCEMKPENCEPRDDIGKFCENYPEACENGTIKGGNLVSSFMIFSLYVINAFHYLFQYS